MSADTSTDTSDICRYCGGYIEHDAQLCPALERGECRP